MRDLLEKAKALTETRRYGHKKAAWLKKAQKDDPKWEPGKRTQTAHVGVPSQPARRGSSLNIKGSRTAAEKKPGLLKRIGKGIKRVLKVRPKSQSQAKHMSNIKSERIEALAEMYELLDEVEEENHVRRID